MPDVGVKLMLRGINALMTSPPVVAEVAARTQRAARQAGPNFEAVVIPHKYTARAFVRSKNAEGAREEAENKTLTRSIDALR